MSFEFKIRPYQGGGDRRQLELTRLPEKYINQYTNRSPCFFALKLLGICSNYLYVMTPKTSPNIVGTILLRKRRCGIQGRFVWKIHAVGIAPELRGHGLGAELLNYAFARLREQKAAEVSLKVDATNEPAIRLYRKYGFVETGKVNAQIIFNKRVEAEA